MKLIRGARAPIGRRDVCVGDSTGIQWLPVPVGRKQLERGRWDWGEDNEGARLLAIAILYEVTSQYRFAQEFSQRYASTVIAALPAVGFVLLVEDIQAWCLEALLCEVGLCDQDEEGIYL